MLLLSSLHHYSVSFSSNDTTPTPSLLLLLLVITFQTTSYDKCCNQVVVISSVAAGASLGQCKCCNGQPPMKIWSGSCTKNQSHFCLGGKILNIYVETDHTVDNFSRRQSGKWWVDLGRKWCVWCKSYMLVFRNRRRRKRGVYISVFISETLTKQNGEMMCQQKRTGGETKNYIYATVWKFVYYHTLLKLFSILHLFLTVCYYNAKKIYIYIEIPRRCFFTTISTHSNFVYSF
jgi:hypothetical protein